MRTSIGMHPLTKTEQQGYSKERLQKQMEGYLPGERRTDPTTGIPYTAYRRDPNHPRWQKKEARKPRPKKVETFDLNELEDAA